MTKFRASNIKTFKSKSGPKFLWLSVSCSHESVSLVPGPAGLCLQTLLLKHNSRVKRRQQNLMPDWHRGQKFGFWLWDSSTTDAASEPATKRRSTALATTARHRSFRSQAPTNRPTNFCATSRTCTPTPTLSTTLRLNWQNSIATSQCCSPCLIDCFASRQALLQSREFSRRAVLLCQLASQACLMLCLSHWFFWNAMQTFSCRTDQFCN